MGEKNELIDPFFFGDGWTFVFLVTGKGFDALVAGRFFFCEIALTLNDAVTELLAEEEEVFFGNEIAVVVVPAVKNDFIVTCGGSALIESSFR